LEARGLVVEARGKVRRGEFVSKAVQEGGNEQYVVHLDVGGRTVIATFETARDTITTFLPPEEDKVGLGPSAAHLW
jgi:hypothetical protein